MQLREGLAALRATGAEIWVPLFLGALAQGYAQGGQAEEGLRVIAEALAMVEKNEERWNEAELYRLKGELTLTAVRSPESQPNSPQPQPLKAEHPTKPKRVFSKPSRLPATQQAKSLELRATMSLARLWQQQGKQTKLTRCCPRSTAGSPKGLTPKTCKRRKRCWKRIEPETRTCGSKRGRGTNNPIARVRLAAGRFLHTI